MQFKDDFLPGIRDGSITVTFRRWQSPRVRVDGTYRIRADLAVKVRTIANVTERSITNAKAKQSGFESRQALLAAIGTSGAIYRVTFQRTSAAPSSGVANADAPLTDADRESIAGKLRATDSRTASGPWTAKALALIGTHPGRRAGDLAPLMGLETQEFKARVRRLKALGLTRSLETGYRLTNRGRAMTRHER